MGARHGHHAADTLEAEHLATGVCSWDCFVRFYRLVDDQGAPICHCGEAVHIAGAECVSCRIRRHPGEWENGETVFSEELLDGLIGPGGP